MHDPTIHREYSPWPPWVTVLTWGSFGVAVFALLASDDGGPLFRYGLAAGFVLFGLLLFLLAGGLTVLVKEDRLFIHLGLVPAFRKTVRYEDVVSLRSASYRPLREFGGWGVRGMGRKLAWTASGSKALVLTLDGGRELYVGSAEPEVLEDRVRRAMRMAGAERS